MNKRLIIFTDLDGTLIDIYDQSFSSSKPALEVAKEKDIPIIFCSAKTKAEQEKLRSILKIKDPFIVENGGAIFIPTNYFSFEFDHNKSINGYKVIELGTPYLKIREIIKKVRKKLDLNILGFGDLKPEEISEITNLKVEDAALAKKREYDETIIVNNIPHEKLKKFLNEIEKTGLKWTHGGRFFHIHGNNDKGIAIKILKNLFKKRFDQIVTVGIGDSKNDIPLLKEVDIAFLVQKKDRSWEKVNLPNLELIQGVGPEGWRMAIKRLLPLFKES